jgi:tetratricopeptide (TPR) repeat protein
MRSSQVVLRHALATAMLSLSGLMLPAAAMPQVASATESPAHHYALLAWSAAMAGRKAQALAAVQELRATGRPGWDLTPQYAVLVRFGLWDEMIALPAPEPRTPGLTAGYLYARGVALAARGRIDNARGVLLALQHLAATASADTLAGTNSLADVLKVAVPVVAARIASSQRHPEQAISLLRQAVAAQDQLVLTEPPDWFFPARHLLGAELLQAGDATQAVDVYREDLKRNPANGWALCGLAAALAAQGSAAAAAHTADLFRTAWKSADVRLPGSAFWFAGPDTTTCECQHVIAALPPPSGKLRRPKPQEP